jgi:hypothetical protein
LIAIESCLQLLVLPRGGIGGWSGSGNFPDFFKCDHNSAM